MAIPHNLTASMPHTLHRRGNRLSKTPDFRRQPCSPRSRIREDAGWNLYPGGYWSPAWASASHSISHLHTACSTSSHHQPWSCPHHVLFCHNNQLMPHTRENPGRHREGALPRSPPRRQPWATPTGPNKKLKPTLISLGDAGEIDEPWQRETPSPGTNGAATKRNGRRDPSRTPTTPHAAPTARRARRDAAARDHHPDSVTTPHPSPTPRRL